MIRAAAKNFFAVLPSLVEPGDYVPILDMLRQAGGLPSGVTTAVRRRLRAESVSLYGEYDAAIVSMLSAINVRSSRFRGGGCRSEGHGDERGQPGARVCAGTTSVCQAT